jgi:hypothetical protein
LVLDRRGVPHGHHLLREVDPFADVVRHLAGLLSLRARQEPRLTCRLDRALQLLEVRFETRNAALVGDPAEVPLELAQLPLGLAERALPLPLEGLRVVEPLARLAPEPEHVLNELGRRAMVLDEALDRALRCRRVERPPTTPRGANRRALLE